MRMKTAVLADWYSTGTISERAENGCRPWLEVWQQQELRLSSVTGVYGHFFS